MIGSARRDTTHETDWGLPSNAQPRRRLVAVWFAVISYLGVLAVFAAVTVLIGGNPGPGIVIIMALLALDLTTVGSQVLRRLDARTIAPGTEERLENLVGGLVERMGVRRPRLFLYEGRGVNGFACRVRGPAIGVSRAALTALNRTELEALVAHCLVRTHSPTLRLAPLAAQTRFFARALGPLVGHAEDVRAAAVTRYPPALMSLLERAIPQTGRYGPFFFASDHPSHVGPDERIAALRDL
jgi:hypothetical protein